MIFKRIARIFVKIDTFVLLSNVVIASFIFAFVANRLQPGEMVIGIELEPLLDFLIILGILISGAIIIWRSEVPIYLNAVLFKGTFAKSIGWLLLFFSTFLMIVLFSKS